MTRKILQSSLELWRGEEVLICPVCGGEYIHPISIKVATDKTVHKIDENGHKAFNGKTAETNEAQGNRGVKIFLEYQCESGHQGFIIFQFHKGSTLIDHEILPFDDDKSVIWRS